jgi:hypothetical protein
MLWFVTGRAPRFGGQGTKNLQILSFPDGISTAGFASLRAEAVENSCMNVYSGMEELTLGRRTSRRRRTRNMALEKELEIFRSKLPELKGEHEGKFVLIHDEQVVDFFSSYEDAIKDGYARFGLEPFLVKKIQALEQAAVLLLSRAGEEEGTTRAQGCFDFASPFLASL